MLRAVLLGVLSLTVISCKAKDESVKSQPGVAAGKAIEVSGRVTLHHGAEARPLAKGDTVEGDDVIETGADGSVQIELAHNNATWELGANKKVKVRDSLAWNEAKKDKSAKAVEQDSAAAGRHAERNAADTTVSAAAPAATEAMPAPAAAPTAPEPKQDMEQKKEERPVAKAAKIEAAPAPRAAAAPQLQPPPAAAAAPPPPPPKTTTRKRESDFSGLGLTGTGEGGGGAGGTINAPDPSVPARAQINTKLAAFKKCFKSTTTVTFNVDAQGRVALAYDGDVDVDAKTCADKVAHSITFAKSATTVVVEIKP